MNIFGFLYDAFGYIIRFIYDIVGNYGITIILFTLIVKVLVFPLSIKQTKSMARMQLLQPKIKEIQEKYKDDKEKLQMETMKLYKKYNANPVSGCLPTLIQLPILMGLYWVINEPLSYVLRMSKDMIEVVKNTLTAAGISLANPSQISIAQSMFGNWNLFENLPEFSNIIPIDFNFLGVSLAEVPKVFFTSQTTGQFMLAYPNWLWAFPVIVWFTSYLSSKFSQTQQTSKASDTADDSSAGQMANTAKTMTTFMPIMMAFFSFTMPSGLSLYWIFSNLFQILQQYFLNKFYIQKNQEEGFTEKVEAEFAAEKEAKKRRHKKK